MYKTCAKIFEEGALVNEAIKTTGSGDYEGNY